MATIRALPKGPIIYVLLFRSNLEDSSIDIQELENVFSVDLIIRVASVAQWVRDGF